MMRFNLAIDIAPTNAAFGSTSDDLATEVARILKIAALGVDVKTSRGIFAGELRDRHGKVVGSWSLT